jgi:hypothetical protein
MPQHWADSLGAYAAAYTSPQVVPKPPGINPHAVLSRFPHLLLVSQREALPVQPHAFLRHFFQPNRPSRPVPDAYLCAPWWSARLWGVGESGTVIFWDSL